MARTDVPHRPRGEGGSVTARILAFLLLAALVLLFAALFSVQNATPVTVWFYNWRFTSTLASVILLALCLGALVMALVFLSLCLRKRLRKREAPPEQSSRGLTSGPAGTTPETGPSDREGPTTPPQGAGPSYN